MTMQVLKPNTQRVCRSSQSQLTFASTRKHSHKLPRTLLAFFNTIELCSYIRPHKHASNPLDEKLVAVQRLMALLSFDDQCAFVDVVRFGTETFDAELAVGVELPANI